MAKKHIRISHRASRTTLAEGPVGWGITPFEGNYWVLVVEADQLLGIISTLDLAAVLRDDSARALRPA